MRGIVNGIDYDDYNPETDEYIVHRYNAENFRKEKIKNKRDLQRQLGMEENDKLLMIGIVSRLTDQKGMDLVSYIMDEMCSRDSIQLVVLGTGEEQYENTFRHLIGNTMGRYLQISFIPRNFRIGYMLPVMHF